MRSVTALSYRTCILSSLGFLRYCMSYSFGSVFPFIRWALFARFRLHLVNVFHSFRLSVIWLGICV